MSKAFSAEIRAPWLAFAGSLFVMLVFSPNLSEFNFDSLINGFLTVFTIFAGFTLASLSILISCQDKEFCKRTKKNGIWKQLLDYQKSMLWWSIFSCSGAVIFEFFGAQRLSIVVFFNLQVSYLLLSLCIAAFAAVIRGIYFFLYFINVITIPEN